MKLKTLKIKSLKACARCGGNHRNLVFKQLRRPIDLDNFWAPCPKTREPLLLRQIVSRYETGRNAQRSLDPKFPIESAHRFRRDK